MYFCYLIENYGQYIDDVTLEDVIQVVDIIKNKSTKINAVLLPDNLQGENND